MKRFRQFLLEKTYNIREDIDFLYGYFFKEFIDAANDNNIDKFINFLDDIQRGKKELNKPISSRKLKSDVCKQAHNINMVTIFGGVFRSPSSYNPFNKKITLTINSNAIGFLYNNILTLTNKNLGFEHLPLGKGDLKRLRSEISENNIKGTIAHELTHWIDDSIHNKFITKKLEFSKELGKKIDNINMTDFELNAQIAAIKELKFNLGKKYDRLDIFDLSQHKPSFAVIFKILYYKEDKKLYNKYMRELFSRLNRENLLGKNMKYISYREFNRKFKTRIL